MFKYSEVDWIYTFNNELQERKLREQSHLRHIKKIKTHLDINLTKKVKYLYVKDTKEEN